MKIPMEGYEEDNKILSFLNSLINSKESQLKQVSRDHRIESYYRYVNFIYYCIFN